MIDEHGKHVWSVIPGVSYSDDTHCFVQVIHANSGQTTYHRYPVESFSAERTHFMVSVGPNIFSDQQIILDLDDDLLKMKGVISFQDTHPFPSRLVAPGIMGWYAYVPFMECYHGVVSMQHQLTGTLRINGTDVLFDGGKGYIEKDWGKSMPSDWIWIQSNHFKSNPDASFMLSLARIPWLKGFFPGFLSFLLIDGEVYRFATYNRSEVTRLEVTEEVVRIQIRNRRYQLSVRVERQEGSILKAPRHGSMDREIKESIISTVVVELKNRMGDPIFSDTGRFAGLEIVGDMEQYYKNNQ